MSIFVFILTDLRTFKYEFFPLGATLILFVQFLPHDSVL